MSDPNDTTTTPDPEATAPEAEPETEQDGLEPAVAVADGDDATDAEVADIAEDEVIAAEAVAEAPVARRRQPRGPRPYAVIETGGKQYRVSVGDSISVEKLDGAPGSDITIERVLLLGGEGPVRVGAPVVDGATVSARIDDQFRGEKIIIFKYKPKKHYRKRIGHRQSLTRLEITSINV